MTNQYPSVCVNCRRRVPPGKGDIRKGGDRGWLCTCHDCLKGGSGSKSSPVAPRVPTSTNRKADYCERCGEPLPAGAGYLYRCGGEATGCQKHYDNEEGGWHVRCPDADKVGCEARRMTRRAEAKAEQEAHLRRAAVTPERWRRTNEAGVTDKACDDEAQAAWSAVPWTLKVQVRSDSEGRVDEGSAAIAGEDLHLYHGGYYDDYRPTYARLVGGAKAYLEALSLDLGKLPLLGEHTFLGHGLRFTVTTRTV